MFPGMDILGGAAGVLGNMAESAWNNYLSNKSAKKAAERNYQYSLRYLQNAPTKQVEGLRDAGLNPILAVSGGFRGSSPSQFSGTPSASSGSGSFSQGVSASANRRLINSQIEAQESVTDKNKADASLARAQIENQLAQAKNQLAQADLARENARYSLEEKSDSALWATVKTPLAGAYKTLLPAYDYLQGKAVDFYDWIRNAPSSPSSSNDKKKVDTGEFVERRTKELERGRYLKGREADMNRSRVW